MGLSLLLESKTTKILDEFDNQRVYDQTGDLEFSHNLTSNKEETVNDRQKQTIQRYIVTGKQIGRAHV